MKHLQKFQLGEIIWTLGGTVQRAGTNNPHHYYLPLRCQVDTVSIGYIGNKRSFIYVVSRPRKYVKQTRRFRTHPITTLVRDYGHDCEENLLSKNKNVMLKVAAQWNKK